MICMLLGTGFEEMEAVAPVDIIRRSKLDVRYVSVMDDLVVTGAHGINIKADMLVADMNENELDMIIIPGGDGVGPVQSSEKAMTAIKALLDSDRFVGAICAAPTILGKRGWIDGRRATCYPDMEGSMGGALVQSGEKVVVDGSLITGQSPAAAVEFGLALVEAVTDWSMRRTIEYFMVYGDARQG